MTQIGNYKINSVSAPVWGNAENTVINVLVDFQHCGVVPFTANPDDVEEHGRLIYAAALNGDFGEIEPYTED